MDTEQRNIESVEHLKRVYPLLSFELLSEKEYIIVKTGANSSYNCPIQNGNIDTLSRLYLDHYHLELSLSHNLMSIYPDLYIHVYVGKDSCNVTCWVNRDNRDHESIGEIDILDETLHEILKTWQSEAKYSKQDGYFFCSGHKMAELKSNYGFFYFAGNYCKQYGIDHPDLVKKAANESYN
jgi:hypothetical protein